MPACGYDPAAMMGSGKRAMADSKQLLHLVFGGELTDPAGSEFVETSKLDLVGIYPNYAEAYAAWRARAQGSVDNAHIRYYIVHLHRLLDPEAAAEAGSS